MIAEIWSGEKKDEHDDWVRTVQHAYTCITKLLPCFSLDPVYSVRPMVPLDLYWKTTIGAEFFFLAVEFSFYSLFTHCGFFQANSNRMCYFQEMIDNKLVFIAFLGVACNGPRYWL